MSIKDLYDGWVPPETPVIYDSSPDCSNIKQYAKAIVEFMKLIQKDNPNQFISQNNFVIPEPVSSNKSYFADPDGGGFFSLFRKATPLRGDYPFLTLVNTYPETPTDLDATAILKGFKEFKTAVATHKRLAAVLNNFKNSSGRPYAIEDFRPVKTPVGYTDSLGEHYLKDATGDDRITMTAGNRYLKYQTFDNLMTGVGRCMQIGGYRRKRSGKRSGSRKQSGKRSGGRKQSGKRSGSRKQSKRSTKRRRRQYL
jgi:hypothetical protein